MGSRLAGLALLLLSPMAAGGQGWPSAAEPSEPAPIGSVWVSNGFLTGEAYLSLPEAHRAAYAMGVIDALLASPFLGANQARVGILFTCVTGKSSTQLEAMVSKQIRDDPSTWHLGANVAAYNAILHACPALTPSL